MQNKLREKLLNLKNMMGNIKISFPDDVQYSDEVKFEQKEPTDDAFFCTKSLWGFLYNKLTFDIPPNSQGWLFGIVKK